MKPGTKHNPIVLDYDEDATQFIEDLMRMGAQEKNMAKAQQYFKSAVAVADGAVIRDALRQRLDLIRANGIYDFGKEFEQAKALLNNEKDTAPKEEQKKALMFLLANLFDEGYYEDLVDELDGWTENDIETILGPRENLVFPRDFEPSYTHASKGTHEDLKKKFIDARSARNELMDQYDKNLPIYANAVDEAYSNLLEAEIEEARQSHEDWPENKSTIIGHIKERLDSL